MPESVLQVHRAGGHELGVVGKGRCGGRQSGVKERRDLRVAEIVQPDVTIENGKIKSYRAKVKLSFKVESKG